MLSKCTWVVLAGASVPATAVAAQGPVATAPARAAIVVEIPVEPARAPPRVDGVLDDQVWSRAPVPVPASEWKSYNPLYGDTLPHRTSVWVAYDSEALYFAFQCDDPEPRGIKTSIARRDNINADDWVGVSLDALGTGQLSYHMMVNPSGIQLDLLNSVAANEDWTVDWVWQSAGRLTATGYAVEIRLPLRSIRFKGGRHMRMGVLFWRRVSRLGVSVSWPALEPSKWVFEKHVGLVFPELRPRLPIDLVPSTAVSRRQVRETPLRWGPASHVSDPGVGLKVGLSPTVTLDATVNPDFSQVETDAFQVELNQRFPVFYSEKRPFFMEGAGIFAMAGSGNDNSLQTAVHTRRIVDPVVGAKLTGSVGRVTFGTLTAVDQSLGSSLPDTDPNAGRERLFNVARVQYGLGPSNYLGAIASSTDFAGTHNRVAGADVSLRLTSAQRITGFVLGSHTTPRQGDAAAGLGTNAGYNYSTRTVVVSGSVEHYSPTFQMDTAFLNRVGITSGWVYGERNFYPGKGRFAWLRRMAPFTFTQGGADKRAEGNDFLEVAGARFNFTRQGFLRIDRSWGFETWVGQRFPRGRQRMWGNVQLYNWLRLDGRFEVGRAIYYDPVTPFEGRSRRTGAGFVLQPNGRLSQSLSYERVVFDRASSGARVYAVDIVNSKTTYLFTRQVFIRSLAQYDSSTRRVLADLLVSYELNPGTVAYLGYGSLIERRGYRDDHWVLGEGDYLTTQRGLVVKVSYLLRL